MGKRRFTVVTWKDMQLMIITVALLAVFCILTTVNLLLPPPRRSFFKIGTKHFLEGLIVNISKYLPGAYFMPGI